MTKTILLLAKLHSAREKLEEVVISEVLLQTGDVSEHLKLKELLPEIIKITECLIEKRRIKYNEREE